MGGDDERARALVARGFAAYARGQVAQAVAEWRLAVSLHPSDEVRLLVHMTVALFPELNGGARRRVDDELLSARTGWCLAGDPVQLDDSDSVPNPIEPEVAVAPSPGWSRAPQAVPVLAARTGDPLSQQDAAARLRSMTMASPIPALLASAMPAIHGEDPASARASDGDITRPVDGGPRLETAPAADVRGRPQEIAELVQRALSGDDARGAADLAETALASVERAAGPEASAALDLVRPACERAFQAFVGPLTAIPVLTVPRALLAAQKLAPLGRRLVYQVDGATPLARILEVTSTARFDGLRAVAGLLRAGIVRLP